MHGSYCFYLHHLPFLHGLLTLQCLCLPETQPFQMVNKALGPNMLALCIQQSAVTGSHTRVWSHTDSRWPLSSDGFFNESAVALEGPSTLLRRDRSKQKKSPSRIRMEQPVWVRTVTALKMGRGMLCEAWETEYKPGSRGWKKRKIVDF